MAKGEHAVSSPIRTLWETAGSNRTGSLAGFTLADAAWLNVTLGMYHVLEVPLVLLNVVDMETQYPVRFDASNTHESLILRWGCINKGYMFFCFEDFELAGLITKTIKRKLFKSEIFFQPFMSTPVTTEPLIGKPTTDLNEAMDWLEARHRKYQEVFPSLTVEKVAQDEKYPTIKLRDLAGSGLLTCLECAHTEEVLVSAHGSDEPCFSSGYQCQSCARLKEIDVFPEDAAKEACECGGLLARNQTLICPQCKSANVSYEMLCIT